MVVYYKKEAAKGDIIVNVPKEFLVDNNSKVVATKEALQLVAYLQSLKQTKLPDGSPVPDFLYKKETKLIENGSKPQEMDGVALYASNCQSCHQANGEGLKGAFPPLKGSPIVLDDRIETLTDIIMNGYDAREEFGVMPAVGTNNNLTAEEVAAIINHEKSSWGNNAKKVTPEEVKKIVDFVKLKSKQ